MSLTFWEALLLFGILGLLAGGFGFLFKTLVQTKDERIKELVAERDYYRSASVLERAMPGELHPAALPPGTPVTIAVATPVPAENGKNGKKVTETRFAMYSLLIQAIISIVVLVLSFLLIVAPTEPTANQVAYQLISFIVGVWLGRGVDYATKR